MTSRFEPSLKASLGLVELASAQVVESEPHHDDVGRRGVSRGQLESVRVPRDRGVEIPGERVEAREIPEGQRFERTVTNRGGHLLGAHRVFTRPLVVAKLAFIHSEIPQTRRGTLTEPGRQRQVQRTRDRLLGVLDTPGIEYSVPKLRRLWISSCRCSVPG